VGTFPSIFDFELVQKLDRLRKLSDDEQVHTVGLRDGKTASLPFSQSQIPKEHG